MMRITISKNSYAYCHRRVRRRRRTGTGEGSAFTAAAALREAADAEAFAFFAASFIFFEAERTLAIFFLVATLDRRLTDRRRPGDADRRRRRRGDADRRRRRAGVLFLCALRRARLVLRAVRLRFVSVDPYRLPWAPYLLRRPVARGWEYGRRKRVSSAFFSAA